MAVAVIDIRVKGQTNLDKLKKQTEKIERLINGIKPIPSLFDSKTARNQTKAIKEFETELKKVAGSQSKLRGTTASVNRQLGNLQTLFSNLTADTTKWRNALVATERAQLSLFQLEQKAMNQRAKSLGSRGGGKDIIPSVLGASGSVAQSVEGLSAYRSELTRLRNSVKLGSKEYKDLGAAIEKVNRTLSAKEGLAGLRQNLDQVSASQSRLLAINSGYVSQTLQVRKAEQALNAELLTRKKVLDAVIIAEQRQMGGAAGVIQKAGRGGIEGLKAALAEAEGIQSRMLTTEQGYIDQLQIVKKLQEAINQEVATRGRLEKTNIQRLKEVGGVIGKGAVNTFRPNRGVEGRGLGLAGLGVTGVGVNAVQQTAAQAAAYKGFAGSLVNWAGAATTATIKGSAFLKILGGIGAAMTGAPQLLGAYIVALTVFGNKVNKFAVEPIKLLGKATFGLGKILANQTATISNVPLKPYSMDLNMTAEATKKLDLAANGAARAQERLARATKARGISTGTVLGGGFGSWSSKMDKKYPTGDARVQMERANQDRRDQMHFMNVVKGANDRLVEVKGKQLDIDQRIERTLKRRGLQIQKNGKYLEKRSNRGMGGMRSGFSGSKAGQAVLGGGFPLLFGGGPGAVAGGAIGGLLGGFAGGIGASVIGGMIDRAVAGIGQLGMAMNPLTADIAKLTTALGLAGTVAGKRIAIIEQLAGKEAALEAVRRRMVQRIGNDNTQALEDFGKTWQAIVNNFQLQLLKIAALVAKFAEKTGLAKWLAGQGAGGSQVITQSQRMQLGASDSKLGKEYRTAKFNRSFAGSRLEDAVAAKNEAFIKSGRNPLFGLTEEGKRLNKELKEANREWDLANSILKRIESDYVALVEMGGVDNLQKRETQQIIDGSLKSLEEQKQVLKDTLQGGTVYAEIQKRIRALKEQTKGIDFEISKEQIKQIENAVKGEEALRRQLELWTQIKDTVATGLTSAIQGLIDGTKSLGESLTSIAKQIGSMLIQSAIMGWLAPVGLPRIPGGTAKGAAEGMYMANGIKPFASGGMATRPTLGLVGEAGEDEYIIPASKMAASMQRYSAGARGEAVIPGTGSSYAGGGAGGSTTVNYSGPILNFNSEQFVPKSAVGEIIATATSQGAKAGENRTLSTLRNSRSARSRLGM